MIKLTKRQQEILTLISEERTTREIAEELGLAIGTIEVHRKTLFRKFKAKNVAGLIKRACIQGHFDEEIREYRQPSYAHMALKI